MTNELTLDEIAKLSGSLREEILRQVLIGLKLPAEAEYDARLIGVDELSRPPDPKFIDDNTLMGLEYWSAAMCVAWMAWGRVDAVRECHPGYSATRRGWVRLPNTQPVRDALKQDGLQHGMAPGFILDNGAPASIAGMITRERKGLPPLPGIPAPRAPVFDALNYFVGMLQEHQGALVVFADHQLSGQTEALPPAAWETLAWGPRRVPHEIGLTWPLDAEENGTSIDFLYADDALLRKPVISYTPVYTAPRVRRVDLLAAIDNMRAEPREPSADIILIADGAEGDIDAGPAFDQLVKARRGRRRGSKNWDATVFMAKYRLMLEAHGKPGSQNPRPWNSAAAAAEHVLQHYVNRLPTGDIQPSSSTALSWGTEATEAWEDAGSPRSQPSGNSGNSD